MRAHKLWGVAAGAALLITPSLGHAGEPELTPAPQGIIDGTLVNECGYASVGSYGVGGQMVCSLVLVAPDVVLTAAHCLVLGGHPSEVHFGEVHDQPRKIVDVEFCRSHPGWVDGWGDVAFCVLAEPVDDIPITPIATACELADVQPGDTLEIIGFGLDQVEDPPFPGEPPQPFGGGVKRRATQLIDELVKPDAEIWMLGMDGVSACYGDSGGPAMVHLPDGQARVVALGQELREDAPPDSICGWGIVYQAVFPHLSWLESRSGRDLTPCWDDGTWDPGPGCGNFAVSPELEIGSWSQGCIGGGLSGPPELVCGDGSDPDPVPDPDPDPDTGDGDGDPAGTTGDPPPPPPPPPDTSDTGSDESGTGGDAGVDWAPERGCGCASGSEDPRGGLGLLALLALVGLRRRSHR